MVGQRRRPLGLDPAPQDHPCLPQGNRARPRPPAPARQGARQDHHCEGEGDRWYVVLSCDDVPAGPLAPTNSTVGIDLGLVSFLTTSDGTHIANPRHLAANTERLTAAQRALSRKKRGSGRREKAVTKITRLHGKVRRQRLDHAHKTALMLVREYGSIVHEKLQIANMTSRP